MRFTLREAVEGFAAWAGVMSFCVGFCALVALAVFTIFDPGSAEAQSPGRSFEWTCSLDNIGATLTQCQHSPEPGMRLYLTDVIANSTTATAGLMLIRTGTGTNCGTGTLSLIPGAATVPRFGYPGNASPAGAFNLISPLRAPSASAICVICTAVNTCTVQLSGYLAP